MNTKEDFISIINRTYHSNIDGFKNDFVPFIEEGINEGIKEGIENGVKEGILDGLTECFNLGFLTIKHKDPKELTEIVKHVASDSITEKVQQECKNELCPIIETNVKNICKQIIKKIEDNEISIDNNFLDLAKKIKVEDMVEKNISEIEQEISQHFPKNNFLYNNILEPLKQSLCKCLNEKYKNCTEKIEMLLIT